MTLAKCRECGSEVSDSAKTCPKCGISKPVKHTSTLVKVILITLLVLIVGPALIGALETSTGISTSQKPDTPEQVARKAAEKKKQSAALDRASRTALLIKQAMRDPESFKLESVLIIDETGAVCYEYRAKNGFGGINAEEAVLSADGKRFKTSTMNGFTTLWNKECANKTGKEEVKMILTILNIAG